MSGNTATLSALNCLGVTGPACYDQGGGGIQNIGVLAVNNSLVIANKAENGGSGGGIWSSGDLVSGLPYSLTLTDTLVTLNTVTGGGTGGGLYWAGTAPVGSLAGVIFNNPDNIN